MSREKDYQILSQYSYWIDENHASYDPSIKVGKAIEGKSDEYKILKTENNTSNGMQAMAVAPVKGDQTDTTEIVIAYAGTNFSDKLDKMTDVQTAVLGSEVLIPEGQPIDLAEHSQLDE